MEYDSLGESEKSRSEIEKSNTATSCPTSVNDFELNFSEGTLQQRKARRTSLSTSVVKVHEKQTILEMVLAALRKAFVSNIPVDALKSLRPKRLMYFTGFIAQVMATLLFLYFVKTVYDSNINQSFMALDPSVGNCNEVVKSVTATVSADSDGVWDSIPTFSYPKQMYEMEFNDIMITTDEYQKILLLWRSEVTALGTRIGVQLDLSQNLILLATWQIYCSESISEACKHFEGQLFHFSASANTIFDLDVYSASMGNVDATCQTNSDVEFSKANGIYEISFNISHFLSMDTCSNIVQPLHMGYNANLDGNTFTLGFDVRLFSSSVSVNYGFTSMLLQPYFEIVDFSKEGSISPRRIISGIEFHFNDHTYIGNYYININMPGAAPMYCIVNKLGSVDLSNFPVPILTPDGKGVYSLCLMAFGDTMYMPVMQHFGYERDDLKLEPRSCHCDQYGKEPECDEFNFLVSFIFYQHHTSRYFPIIDQMKALLNVTVTNGGYNQLSINSYNASYIIASNAYSDDSKEDVLINDTEWRTNSFSFCHGECSMVTLHTYNKFSVNETNKHTVSPYLAQVNNGSCADIFSVSDNAFHQMISTYPVKFTEDYYECYPHVFDALIDSIGIGAGNAAMYVPLVFSVVLPFLYLWLDYIGIKTPSTEYGNTDKERVWDQLIICLLRAKYKKTKGMEKGNPRSGLIALADDIEDITRRARKKDSKRKRKQKNSEQGNGKSPV